MCSSGLVSKPQGEPGAKPAHNAHFLNFRVIGWELTSCVLGVTVSKPKGEPGTKLLYSRVISSELMPGALGPGVESTR